MRENSYLTSTLMLERPIDEVETISSTSSSSWIAVSSASVTSLATSSAVAPGYRVTTAAVRMVNSGSSKRAMFR